MRNLTFVYHFAETAHIVLVDPDTGAVTGVGTAPYRANVTEANRRIREYNRTVETPRGVVRG